MHVATPAAGGSLDCSFDKIHNLINSYNVYVLNKLEIITTKTRQRMRTELYTYVSIS